MANTMRWRYGETNPVMVAVDESDEVEIGDLVFLHNQTAKPACQATSPSGFKASFLGVAMQYSPRGEAAAIRIATTGVFEFEAVPTDFTVGDLIEVRSSPTESQGVGFAMSAETAIARCAATVPVASARRVLADIVSTVMRGGVQVYEPATTV